MRTEIDHLPPAKQRELERVIGLLMGEFEQAIAGGTQPFRKNGKILKIILFGSYARGDWVDEPHNGYQSDFDLLIVVSHEKLTDIADYWYVAEDKILRDPKIGRTVNIIVHTLQEVNAALGKGQYFFTDIARDGIVLYELPGHALATPMPPTAKDAYEVAKGYFEDWSKKIESALKIARFAIEQSELNDGAFLLHQAVERCYACFLLVRTLYFPRSHNIKFLRSLAEQADARLIGAWPRDNKTDRRRFELLKRAYVEARYSPSYKISAEDLDALAESAVRLRDVVQSVCLERLETLRREASAP
ncbi:MAG: HEPN domain-containing protein [Phenylobacterium sp.]|uniref:HEPN domain-containing protein n=1 Tax=Phenylobacterium sp. TaxID=1871053 RepID=UPI0025D36642|nr:HEPN domain-containing protein [Phenylobacterium sp.]MBI1198954.1 HEPN domain-containing protein [Phenylobacterium sp.]